MSNIDGKYFFLCSNVRVWWACTRSVYAVCCRFERLWTTDKLRLEPQQFLLPMGLVSEQLSISLYWNWRVCAHSLESERVAYKRRSRDSNKNNRERMKRTNKQLSTVCVCVFSHSMWIIILSMWLNHGCWCCCCFCLLVRCNNRTICTSTQTHTTTKRWRLAHKRHVHMFCMQYV